MSQPAHPLRFSFQTKVLAPVLVALVLLPAITLWMVDRSMRRQLEAEARQTLKTAETVFQQLLELRARELLSRCRNAVNEPSYRSITQIVRQNDPVARETARKFLDERFDAFGRDCDALLLTTDPATDPVGVRRAGLREARDFAGAAARFTGAALQGEATHGALDLDGHTYLLAAVPIIAPESGLLIGALTVATRIGDPALQEFKSITGADILLVSDRVVTASTVRNSDLPASLLGENPLDSHRTLPVELDGEHFYALTDDYRSAPGPAGFHYVLLSSYEQRLREMEGLRTTLLGVSIASILLCGLVVWMVIRRITSPLLELRDSAEAVGRGDFSRRITRFASDECGAVAVAFNDMTGNLQASRAELEKAVGSLKTTQAQLIQSEKLSAVGQFVAGVAHELNNPLTAVIGFSDLLQLTELEPQHRGYLAQISRNANRCHKIVNSLLGFSRQHEPERKPVRLGELADAVIEIIAYDLRTSNISLVKAYQPDLPRILGDSHQLQQVVLNIISNARQALENFRRDGQITLRTGSNETHVWLRIEDNGPGISRENLARIFDPFFTTKPQGKGTGLGLSLSYGIMQEHRGRIRAESEPGSGTVFILELPVSDPGDLLADGRPASAAPLPPVATGLLPVATGLLVLVVDDEDAILHLVQEVLHLEGHRVEIAATGAAALELIRRHRYDVIVTDWKMPGLDGINLYHEVAATDPAAAQRMLFMTGDVIKESFQEFLKKFGRTCLPKPFSLREFHAAIAAIVQSG